MQQWLVSNVAMLLEVCSAHKIMETGIGQHALFALPVR